MLYACAGLVFLNYVVNKLIVCCVQNDIKWNNDFLKENI